MVGSALLLIAVVLGFWLIPDRGSEPLNGSQLISQEEAEEIAWEEEGRAIKPGSVESSLKEREGRPVWEVLYEDACVHGMSLPPGFCAADSAVVIMDAQSGEVIVISGP